MNLLPKCPNSRIKVCMAKHGDIFNWSERGYHIVQASLDINWTTIQDNFPQLILTQWLIECCMHNTSEEIVKSGGSGVTKESAWGMRYIDLWLLMDICYGWSKVNFLDAIPYNPFTYLIPYQVFNMSWHFFSHITWQLCFKRKMSPADCFGELNNMVLIWNKEWKHREIFSHVGSID